MSIEKIALVLIRMETFILNLEKSVSNLTKREDWERPLWFLRAPALGIRGNLGKLVRRLSVPEALQFVTISLLMLSIFAIKSEGMRFFFFVLFHRGAFICWMELKIKSLSDLTSR